MFFDLDDIRVRKQEHWIGTWCALEKCGKGANKWCSQLWYYFKSVEANDAKNLGALSFKCNQLCTIGQ